MVADGEQVNESPVIDTPLPEILAASNQVITISGEFLEYTAVDGDGDPIELISVQSSIGGVVDINLGGDVIFSPNDGFDGVASFSYTLSDGNGGQALGIVSISYPEQNTIPEISPNSSLGGFSEDTSRHVTEDEILSFANDADGDLLTVESISSGSVDLTVTSNNDGGWTLTPVNNFSGQGIPINITVSDGADSVTGPVYIDVLPINDAPEVGEQLVDHSFEEDAEVNFTLPEMAFIDVEGDLLTLSASLADGGELPNWLTFNPFTRQFSGQPSENYNGLFEIKVEASDGIESISSMFSLSVIAVNDNPIAGDDLGFEVNQNEVLTIPIVELLANDVDVDGDVISISSIQSGVNGTAEIVGPNILFTPHQDVSGPAGFIYDLSDGSGGNASGSVEVSILEDVSGPEPTLGADSLQGTLSDDIIDALAGDDFVLGLSGNDVIIGGLGSDVIDGGEGSDILSGDQSNGANHWNDRDTFVYGDVRNSSIGNDTITDFDTNNYWGGEINFDTLSFEFNGRSYSLKTGRDVVSFVYTIEHDGSSDTDAIRDGSDLIFVFQRDDIGVITDSIRLEDIIGDDGVSSLRLGIASVDYLTAQDVFVSDGQSVAGQENLNQKKIAPPIMEVQPSDVEASSGVDVDLETLFIGGGIDGYLSEFVTDVYAPDSFDFSAVKGEERPNDYEVEVALATGSVHSDLSTDLPIGSGVEGIAAWSFELNDFEIRPEFGSDWSLQ